MTWRFGVAGLANGVVKLASSLCQPATFNKLIPRTQFKTTRCHNGINAMLNAAQIEGSNRMRRCVVSCSRRRNLFPLKSVRLFKIASTRQILNARPRQANNRLAGSRGSTDKTEAAAAASSSYITLRTSCRCRRSVLRGEKKGNGTVVTPAK